MYFIAAGSVEILVPTLIAESLAKAAPTGAGAGSDAISQAAMKALPYATLEFTSSMRDEPEGYAVERPGIDEGTSTPSSEGDHRRKVSAERHGKSTTDPRLYVGTATEEGQAHDSQARVEDMKCLTQLGTPSFFGEMALLNQEGTTVASVRVSGFLEAYHLSISAYMQLLSTFPAFKSYVEAVARLRLEALIKAEAKDVARVNRMMRPSKEKPSKRTYPKDPSTCKGHCLTSSEHQVTSNKPQPTSGGEVQPSKVRPAHEPGRAELQMEVPPTPSTEASMAYACTSCAAAAEHLPQPLTGEKRTTACKERGRSLPWRWDKREVSHAAPCRV